jgi:hypothetical protein
MTPRVFIASVCSVRNDATIPWGNLIPTTEDDYKEARKTAKRKAWQQAEMRFPQADGWRDTTITLLALSAKYIDSICTHMHGESL